MNCAYCGIHDAPPPEQVKCRCCDRMVCWSPTCRAPGETGGDALCATCAGTLPEVAVDNPDYTCGTCPICDGELHFLKVLEIVEKLPANAYRCDRGHLTLTADHGHTQVLDGMFNLATGATR